MDPILEQQVRILVDKNAIEECLLRYTRGVDRLDVELIKSAFHPDALDNHTRAVRGSVDTMLDWWLPQQADREAQHHFVTNQTIDIDGDVAHSESYFLTFIKMSTSPAGTLSAGRYIDRLEKRAGQWKVALRTVLTEWQASVDASLTSEFLPGLVMGLQRRDRSDPSYDRPLTDPPAQA